MGSARFALLTAFLVSLPFVALGQQAAALAYTPSVSACPQGTELLRLAGTEAAHQTLNSDEREYISTRESKVIPKAWTTYLGNVKAYAKSAHIKLPSYVSEIMDCCERADLPRLAITASGGSYRAAIFSAGVMNALDARNTTSVRAGTGGLLQTASYLGALSGGAWLVSSLIQANFPMLPELIFGSNMVSAPVGANVFEGWNAQFDLLEPSTDPAVVEAFLELLLEEIAGKVEAGFPVTVVDVWARSLSRHFCNGTTTADFFSPNITHGAGITLSGLVDLPTFEQHIIPFPIMVSDSVSKFENHSPKVNVPGESVPLTNPIYEFTPYEMGSYDPMLGAFTPTKLLGSRNGECVTGFDQLALVAGASSAVFNSFNTSAAALAASSVGTIIEFLNATFPQANVELDAAAVPNPFFGVAPKTYLDSNQTLLALVDGGNDGEVSPLQPMLVKARGVDVIFVMDAPADTEDNFTNGSSIISTQERVALFPHSYSFPPTPTSPNTFVKEGLVKRPTFFGCNSRTDVPLVIYLANGAAPLGQAPLTNTTTAQTAYQAGEIEGMLNQVYDIATQGIPVNGTEKDPEWPVCLMCAVVDRTREKLGEQRSGVCAQCLERYCWS